MIILRLAGGLGNQLFQILAASLYSSLLSRRVLIISSSVHKYHVPRKVLYKYIFNSPSSFLEAGQNYALLRFFSETCRIGRLPVPGLAINDSLFLNPSTLSPKYSTYIFADGYFQAGWSYNTFHKALSSFVPVPFFPAIQDSPLSDEVVIHIRGSDFLGSPTFRIVDHRFYLRCIELARCQGFDRFLIVSDDSKYATSFCSLFSQQYPGLTFRVAPSRSAIEDFNIIRASKARIIGNSTFSWWASVLATEGPTWSCPNFTRLLPKPFALPYEVFVEGDEVIH